MGHFSETQYILLGIRVFFVSGASFDQVAVCLILICPSDSGALAKGTGWGIEWGMVPEWIHRYGISDSYAGMLPPPLLLLTLLLNVLPAISEHTGCSRKIPAQSFAHDKF